MSNDEINKFIDMACKGDITKIKEFVKNGIDINSTDKNSEQTALTIASRSGQLDIVKYLVEQGADVNVRDNGGRTALNYAEKHKRKDIVDYLKEHGTK